MSADLLKKTTMKEVAERAGVSLATVDRVLSNRAKVRPRTKERVLNAIESLNQQGALPTQQNSLTYHVILESGAPFINAIKDTFEALKTYLDSADVLCKFHLITFFEQSAFLELLQDSARESDGLILLCREHPAISACVNKLVNEGCPVVCLTTDLCDTARLAYVGMNHVSAGRTAAQLTGRFVGPNDGEVVLVVSASYRAQYERELGFRRVIREQFPNLRIRESLNNHDLDEDSYDSLMSLFRQGVKPLAIYNVTGGNLGVAKALMEMGWTKDVVFIGHELNDSSYSLLSNDQMDVVIDQDLKSEVINAINVLRFAKGHIGESPTVTPTAPIITLKENLGARMNSELLEHSF